MNRTKEIFLKYPPQRDAVFILGAGTSHPDGIPLQRHILPQILNGKIKEINKSDIGKAVKGFIDDNFVYDIENKDYPQMEGVFGFIDYFIEQNESLSAKYNNLVIREIKEYLIKLIHYIVDLNTNKNSIYYRLFWEAIQKYNSNVSILTLNYDTLLEHSFEFLFENFGYIDYCLPFMNYVDSHKLKEFNFWINPREPVSVVGDNSPALIKILKLHGSLNWKYCNCCNQILLTTWDRKIDLQRGKFLGYTHPDQKEYEYTCPLDGTEFQTLIVAPSHVKPLKHPVILNLLNEAAREIRSTKKFIFVGYSMSDTDVHIKALFKKNIRDDAEIFVVSPSSDVTFKSNYYALSKNVTFIDSTFQDMVSSDNFLANLIK